MKYLLIWNGFQEGIRYYLVPGDAEGAGDLELAHGEYEGTDIPDDESYDAVGRISDRVCDDVSYCQDESIGASWSEYRVDVEEPIDLSGEVRVIETGFIP